MSWLGWFAVYFITWWITLFAVMPFGTHSAHEAGEAVEPGHEPGAPLKPMVGRKMIVTTIVAALICASVYWVVVLSGLNLDDLPGPFDTSSYH